MSLADEHAEALERAIIDKHMKQLGEAYLTLIFDRMTFAGVRVKHLYHLIYASGIRFARNDAEADLIIRTINQRIPPPLIPPEDEPYPIGLMRMATQEDDK